MAAISERTGRLLNTLESRWSLVALIQGSGLVASFSLPAWAVWAASIFSQYSPFSWVVAGFLGVLIWSFIRVLWQGANRLKVRTRFDAKSLQDGSRVNPLDLTFERKRILLNDFVLPSFAFIDGKTFIECDLIGPANIYFATSNNAQPIRPPKIDAVWLGPTAIFNNGFVFSNCIFRNCSFQRITLFASVENYASWKDNPNVNWISIPPSPEHIAERMKQLDGKELQANTPEDETKALPAQPPQAPLQPDTPEKT
ncbi:hypothetical protein [Bradyrhizobium sp. USDA 4452]